MLDLTGAIEDFGKVISLDSNMTEAYFMRGQCRAKLDDLDGALLDWNTVLDQNPKHYAAINSTASVKFQLEDFEDALNYYSFLIENDQFLPDSYFVRAICRLKLNRLDESCSDLREACDLGHKIACENYNQFNFCGS